MLDLNDILSTPGYDVQYFEGSFSSQTLWQTWKKPRGVNWVYILAVGAGGGGGSGRVATAGGGGGGGGGGSGGLSTIFMPAMFIPDTLFVSCPVGGSPSTAGNDTKVSLQPFTASTHINYTLLYANGGNPGSASGGLTGGAGGTGAPVTSFASSSYYGFRGRATFIAGQAGAAGGTSTTAGNSITPPSTGIIVTGGAGGGGSNTAGFAGGIISTISGTLGNDFFNLPTIAANGATGSTPAERGANGFKSKFMNFGGGGGGGASTTAGGVLGRGGDGAPGCGGGGGGGGNTTVATNAGPGNGGPGFVYIISF